MQIKGTCKRMGYRNAATLASPPPTAYERVQFIRHQHRRLHSKAVNEPYNGATGIEIAIPPPHRDLLHAKDLPAVAWLRKILGPPAEHYKLHAPAQFGLARAGGVFHGQIGTEVCDGADRQCIGGVSMYDAHQKRSPAGQVGRTKKKVEKKRRASRM